MQRRALRAGRDAWLAQHDELPALAERAFEALALVVDPFELGQLPAQQIGPVLTLAVGLQDESAEIAKRYLATTPEVAQPSSELRALQEARRARDIVAGVVRRGDVGRGRLVQYRLRLR